METSSSNAQPLYLQFIGNPTRNQFKAQDLMPTRHQFLKVEAELLVSHKKLGVSILPEYIHVFEADTVCFEMYLSKIQTPNKMCKSPFCISGLLGHLCKH